MATRHKTRLCAGAALVTGLGMMSVATALPAQAATTVTYTCTMPDPAGSEDITVTFDTNAPATVGPGETLTVDSVTAETTIPAADIPADTDTSGIQMAFPVTAPVRTDGEVVAEVSTTLTSGDIQVGDGQVHASLSSTETHSVDVPIEAAGMTFDVLVPPALAGTLTLPTPDGGEPANIPVDCTTTSTDSVIDTVVVTSPEMDEEPHDAEDTAEVHAPDEGEQPAVPQVVQTDGLTPQMVSRDDHTLGYAVGGLLLAGVGAGAVLVARRRATEH